MWLCLTQYRPRSLNDHIGIGKPWDLDRASGGVRLLQPYTGGPYGDWQRGSADAVRRNLDFVRPQNEESRPDPGRQASLPHGLPAYDRHHVQTDADVTVAVRRVEPPRNPPLRHRLHRGAGWPSSSSRRSPTAHAETLASMGSLCLPQRRSDRSWRVQPQGLWPAHSARAAGR